MMQSPPRIHSVSPQPRVESWQHGVIWHGVEQITVTLDGAHWYGQGALIHQLYPLERMAQYVSPFITSDNGATGLLGILEPFWFNSEGLGILVENDTFSAGFNAPLDGAPPPQSYSTPAPHAHRPPQAAGLATDGLLTLKGDNLTIRFFLLEDARKVVEAFWNLITISAPPPDWLLEKPLWTTWAQFKCDISHAVVTQYLNDIHMHDFRCNLLGIDARWQAEMGDSTFNSQTFPDPAATVQAAASTGTRLTVWTAPYIEPQSANYAEGAEQGHYVKDAAGAPALLKWWGGAGGFVNPASDAALDWYFSAFQRDLVEPYGIHGIKVDGGEALFFQQGGYEHVDGMALNTLNRRYVDHAAAHFPWSDTRSGWRNQSTPALFRQWDKSSAWGYDNGLASCITQAITLNLLGYPYSFPDMIGGNMYDHGPLEGSAELLIRWTQAVAPMPLIQFSLSPWEYGVECAALCARYAALHEELASLRIALAHANAPIVRPLWWLAPTDPVAQVIGDQYLVGDDLLVAPVIQPCARARDVYLPAGKWQNYWDAAEIFAGGGWLEDYPAPLETLPLFIRQPAD